MGNMTTVKNVDDEIEQDLLATEHSLFFSLCEKEYTEKKLGEAQQKCEESWSAKGLLYLYKRMEREQSLVLCYFLFVFQDHGCGVAIPPFPTISLGLKLLGGKRKKERSFQLSLMPDLVVS